jgi:hypothetical protein
VGAWVEKQEPGTGVAGEDGLYALTIKPAGDFDGLGGGDRGNVGVDEAADTVGYAGGNAGKTGAGGGEDDGGLRGAAEGFEGGGVACVAGLGEGLTGDG